VGAAGIRDRVKSQIRHKATIGFGGDVSSHSVESDNAISYNSRFCPAGDTSCRTGSFLDIHRVRDGGINLQKIGITVFGNELNKVPVDSWQIDNLVVSKISAYLSKNWSLRPISYPKGAFATLEQDHGIFYNRDAELTEIIRRVTSSTKCDHYVVVLKGSSGYGTTNQSLYGLGVLEVGAPIMITDMLFALYVIKVYDGQTFAVLGQQQAILDENHFSSIHGPFRQLYTNFTFPQPGTVPGPAVRDGLRSLVEKSLDVTMPQILRIE
jgi:hypothetical protein